MIVTQITKEQAAIVVKDPEIYDRIAKDACPNPDDFEMPDIKYLGCYIDDNLAAVFMDVEERSHFQVLKPYRKHAREIAKLFIDVHGYPVIGEVPTLYMSYINFLKKLGFELLSIAKSNYTKNGVKYDTHRLILCHS